MEKNYVAKRTVSLSTISYMRGRIITRYPYEKKAPALPLVRSEGCENGTA